MNSYIPQVGHKVLVNYDDLGLHAETINEVSPDGSWILLFQGDPGEQLAACDSKGVWRLQESGQDVYPLNPQARPERSGLGFVIPASGPVEQWYMDNEHMPGYAEGFLHTEQIAGIAHIQDDGTWVMNETDQVFFITERQAAPLTGALLDEEDETETAAILADPDAMQAIAEAVNEVVDPETLTGKGPHLGDATSRVINDVSLLYRVFRVETNEFGHSYVTLTLLPDVLGYPPYEQVARDPRTGRCTWSDGEPVMFTSGQTDDLALAATRLTTLRTVLRSKYFHYEAMIAANSSPGADMTRMFAHNVAVAIRDEYAEQLFLMETGLRYDQAAEKFEEFYEALHDEFLASQEQ